MEGALHNLWRERVRSGLPERGVLGARPKHFSIERSMSNHQCQLQEPKNHNQFFMYVRGPDLLRVRGTCFWACWLQSASGEVKGVDGRAALNSAQ